jgi:DNA topoisomerase II
MSREGEVKNPFDHALKRPDTYIGSVKTLDKEVWTCEKVEPASDDKKKKNQEPYRIVKKVIPYNSGLLRIFIEIMSNAVDNKWRSQESDTPMKKIEFTLDDDEDSETYGWITIWNDGYCIPVEKKTYTIHDYRRRKSQQEKVYPAEMFFGEMLSGTNFDDTGERKTSGRNGIGGKAANIFSLHFTVEHTDPDNKKRFYQTYKNHGKEHTDPKITTYLVKTGYTKISFLPDYEYFGYPGLDENLMMFLRRQIYDCAMITNIPISLNEEKIHIKDLQKYARLYFSEGNMLSLKTTDGDECVVVEVDAEDAITSDDVGHMAFVNGIHTRDGGTHIDAWRDAIVPLFVRLFNSRKVNTKKGGVKTSAKHVHPYLMFFVRCEIDKPGFDSQTKDKLVSPAPFPLHGNTKKDKDEFVAIITDGVTKMLKWGFVKTLEEKLAFLEERALSKKDGTAKKKVSMGAKLDDANLAGTGRGRECVLFIAEGLSAKSFVDEMISKMPNGSDLYGSFAIRGKFMNVQKATYKQICDNKEVQALKETLGLVGKMDYSDPENFATLRYGKACILTDADDDGIHIRGLLLNFFYHGWSQLYKMGYVQSFSTAVVKVTLGNTKAKNASTTLFYSNPSFEKWCTDASTKKYACRYYKGLGTHRPGEAQMYIDNPKYVTYTLDKRAGEYMDLGFKEAKSNDERQKRKAWMLEGIPEPGTLTIGETKKEPDFVFEGDLSVSRFIDEQLIIFNRMSLGRAIPDMYDGFKDSQRKAFFGIARDPDAKKKTVSVASLAGTVKKMTEYHHGEVSLEDTIKKMAAGYPDSNNIPLLVNAGQFGTRKVGGKDASASRYVETQLEDIAYVIFHPDDEALLTRRMDGQKEIEFERYYPIMPMVLVNGAEGIASGFSTTVPCYNPEDIVEWIKDWLVNRAVGRPPLVPWYRGFNGRNYLSKRNMDDEKYTAWTSEGILEKRTHPGTKRAAGKDRYVIREIPVGKWISDVKEHIEKLQSERWLSDVRWSGTNNTPLWEITPSKNFIPDMKTKGNFDILCHTHSLCNIIVLDENNYPRRYDAPEDLLNDFCAKRLEVYGARKAHLLQAWENEIHRETNRLKFVRAVVEKKLEMRQEDDALEVAMLKLKLSKIDDSFDYLLNMHIRSLTKKKIEELEALVIKLQEKHATLKKKKPSEIWLEDLAAFKVAYKKFLKTRVEE